MSQNWAAQELSGIDLSDARLNKRLVMLLGRLAPVEQPLCNRRAASLGNRIIL